TTSSYPIQKFPLLIYPTRPTMSKPCNTCGQLFTSTYALEEHILKAPNHPKCATCKKSFRDEKGLEQHIQKEHQALLCGVCMARFPSRQALADHIARAHPSSTRRSGSTPPVGALQCKLRAHLSQDTPLPRTVPPLLRRRQSVHSLLR
ncbi:hypothetical protein GGF50DRAFT_102060, partial [Schizophyllum commune]